MQLPSGRVSAPVLARVRARTSALASIGLVLGVVAALAVVTGALVVLGVAVGVLALVVAVGYPPPVTTLTWLAGPRRSSACCWRPGDRGRHPRDQRCAARPGYRYQPGREAAGLAARLVQLTGDRNTTFHPRCASALSIMNKDTSVRYGGESSGAACQALGAVGITSRTGCDLPQ